VKRGIIIAVLFVAGIIVAKSQVTIKDINMPQKGDTFRYSLGILDTAAIFNFLDTGANQVWDFDSLIPLRQGAYKYVSVASTPYNSVPNNRIAELITDTFFLEQFELYDVYSFYKADTNKFAIDHLGASIPTGLSFPFPAIFKIQQSYSDADEVYQFPLDYGDRDSSTYKFTFNNSFPPAYFSRSGYRINNVDAWGSMKTPFGTYNCIRVVTDIVGLDSLNFDTIDIGLSTHQREYKWLSDQVKLPILKISGLVLGDVFVPSSVEFRDSVRNLPNVLTPIALFSADDFTPRITDTVEFSNLSISFRRPRFSWKITPSTYSLVNGTTLKSENLSVIFNDTVNYDVELIAESSGGNDTLSFVNYIRVEKITAIDEVNLEYNSVNLYPNPISKSQWLNVDGLNKAKIETVELFALNGTKVSQLAFVSNEQHQLLKAPAKTGMYILRLRLNNNQLLMSKLIVR